jgi:hydrogenase/urease accessory protein HupE
MRRLAGLCLLLLTAGFAGQPAAHELQPSSFELRQLTQERYEIIWRAPTYYRKPHPARLQLPDNWQPAGAAKVTRLADGALHRRLVDIPPDTVDGAIIRFVGLEATITDVFARFVWLDGTETTAIARPSQPWLEVVAQRNAWQVAWDYTLLGMDHILSGFDHLTFVLALLLIVSGARRLLITITSFTLAHSITLAAATLGVLWVPGAPVEATIALSILFLASELVKVNRGQPSLTASYPWIVAFVFGLLHGFGFAGALGDIGLPQNEIPLLAIVMILNRLRREWPAWTRQIPAYGIGGIAAFWLIERIAGF